MPNDNSFDSSDCEDISLKLKKLNTEELKDSLIGKDMFGFTCNSRQPYVLRFNEDGTLLKTIGITPHLGEYRIEDDNVFTIWDKPHHTPYLSDHPNSNFHPEHKLNKVCMSGQFRIEFWEMIGVSSTKRVFLRKHKQHRVDWGSPCFIYK